MKTSPLAPALMLQGAGSDVGKSMLMVGAQEGVWAGWG